MTYRLSQIFTGLVLGLAAAQSAYSAEINREWVEFTPPAEIKWRKNPNGSNESAILHGDPSKPGPYVMRIKWYPGKFSRPHWHPNDRFFVVISGTWWQGTGTKYDPASTVPAPAGSYVYHRAKGIHYDGAKDEEAIIQVWGMGPATSTPAEEK